MTWDRSIAAPALAAALSNAVADAGMPWSVFDRPPGTINPPALVVGRPIEVRFSEVAFSVDTTELPVACVGPVEGEDLVADLITLARQALRTGDGSLGGAVQYCWPSAERNWRQINVAGVDLLSADVIFTIQM